MAFGEQSSGEVLQVEKEVPVYTMVTIVNRTVLYI